MLLHLPGPAALNVNTIYCIGRNYADHAKELNNPLPTEPVVFLKANASLRALDADDQLAYADESFHHEAEIIAIITKEIPLGHRADWQDVGALALGLDLTRRTKQDELKKAGLPWTLAKSFVGAAVISEALPLKTFHDLENLEFKLSVNDQTRQTGNSREMLFAIPSLLSFLLRSHRLLPGDLIYTGTPAGVGPIQKGDRFTLEWVKEQRRYDGRL